MKIYVKIITGQTLTLNVELNDTVEYVKQCIENDQNGITKSLIKELYFKDIKLNDTQILSDYNIQDGDTFYIIMRL
jgi:hypothetical protein